MVAHGSQGLGTWLLRLGAITCRQQLIRATAPGPGVSVGSPPTTKRRRTSRWDGAARCRSRSLFALETSQRLPGRGPSMPGTSDDTRGRLEN